MPNLPPSVFGDGSLGDSQGAVSLPGAAGRGAPWSAPDWAGLARRVPREVLPFLPPASRRWLLTAAGAGAGTVGLLGVVLTAELLAARRRALLPETAYERVLAFPGTAPAGTGRPLTLAVLGDSTTTGVGTERVEDTYAAVVGLALAERGPVEVHVLGRASARVGDVLREQLPRAAALRPDLVLLVVGANDAIHVTRFGDLRRDLRAVLDALAALGAAPGAVPVVLAGVPRLTLSTLLAHPLRELSGWRGARVNLQLRLAAEGRPGITFVPLATRLPEVVAGDPRAWLSTDGFHPSAAGYAHWALAFTPALLAADPRVRRDDPAG